MRFLLRVVVASSIAVAFLIVRDFRVVGETLVTAVCAFGLAELAALIYDKHRGAGFAVAGVLACGALGGAALYHVKKYPAPLAYRDVDAVMADPDHWVGDTMKLHGYIELGSLHARVENQNPIRTFVIHVKDKRVTARISGPVPDAFQDRAEVVATGTLIHDSNSYLFDATEVMAKCPSTYQTASGPQPAAKFR